MRDIVQSLAGALPGATLDHNFGPDIDSWKVGGKLFAIARADGVSVKCPDRETAEMLGEIGQAEPAPYLAKAGWVHVTAKALEGTRVTEADLAHRLHVSYDRIVATLPKRLRPTPEA